MSLTNQPLPNTTWTLDVSTIPTEETEILNSFFVYFKFSVKNGNFLNFNDNMSKLGVAPGGVVFYVP